jgi:hypothetical protein
MIINVPSWAYDFCYYYLALAAIIVVSAIYSSVELLLLPPAVKKVVPIVGTVLSLLVSAVISTLLVMMQFWVCRSALAPTKEKFAVTCKTTADCTAVTGTPQGPMCTCGGRGFCGGCVMQNEMEPSMMPEYAGFD